jgi:tripartite-type tricarboxylate transporter receptor subunit TctC
MSHPQSAPARRPITLAAAATIAALLCPTLAVAQAYPTKIVRVIVPFAPGGGSDITSRQVSTKLAEMFKHQFIVENRAGAGGIVGMDAQARV